jgi:hypothetical protein
MFVVTNWAISERSLYTVIRVSQTRWKALAGWSLQVNDNDNSRYLPIILYARQRSQAASH